MTIPIHDPKKLPSVLRQMAQYDMLRRGVLEEAADLIDSLHLQIAEHREDDARLAEGRDPQEGGDPMEAFGRRAAAVDIRRAK